MTQLCRGHENGTPADVCPVCLVVQEKEAIRDALKGLMAAHRVVFRNSLFAGFRAGKSTFHEAWKQAEKYADGVPDDA
jgi:hypothetical protein